MQESDRALTRRDTTARRMPRALMAFEVTSYRWLWASFLFGSMSMSVRMLAQGWLVLELTDSPFWVGAIAGVQGLGLVGFGALGGTLVERYDKRVVLGIVYFCGFVVSGLTGFLAITGQVQLWHMAPIALAQGMLMGTQLPASNVLAYQIVGPERLLNAMAARLMALNISRVIGSLIAGWLIHSFGVGSSYVLAASGSALGLAFLLVIRGDFRAAPQREPFWQSTGHGLRYAWQNHAIRRLLFLSLLMEAFGFSHLVMMPVMARDVLEVGATGLGYLSAASGLGSMLSTFAVASLGDFRRKGTLLAFTHFGRRRVDCAVRLLAHLRPLTADGGDGRRLPDGLRRHHGHDAPTALRRRNAGPGARNLRPHVRIHLSGRFPCRRRGLRSQPAVRRGDGRRVHHAVHQHYLPLRAAP